MNRKPEYEEQGLRETALAVKKILEAKNWTHSEFIAYHPIFCNVLSRCKNKKMRMSVVGALELEKSHPQLNIRAVDIYPEIVGLLRIGKPGLNLGKSNYGS